MKIEDLRKFLYLKYNPVVITGFRRKALATNNEILAYLLGTTWKNDDGILCVEVEELYYPELIVQNETTVQAVGGRIKNCVGSIHSHPNVEAIGPSMEDHHSAILDNEIVWGVYYFSPPRKSGRRQTALQWLAPGKVVMVDK
jgi:proteasome lid subunit RPN8/RPN11